MKFFKYISLLLPAFLLSSYLSFSQKIEINTKLEKDSIIIGEQIEYIIDAKTPKGTKLFFPTLKDTISKKIEIIQESEIENVEDENTSNYIKKYLITSFDTGLNTIASIPLQYINNGDTSIVLTSQNQILVCPYALIDTIARDTTFANSKGFIVFGKDRFKNEIENYIPDSIKKTISKDSLQVIKAELEEVVKRMFNLELQEKTKITDKEDISKIFESSTQKMFIVDTDGIQETFTVPGSIDSLFVAEFAEVKTGDILFTTFKIKDISEELTEFSFSWSEFWYYLKKYFFQYWWIIVILLIITGGIIYYFLFHKNKTKISIFKVKPSAPAHIIALQKLENIKNEKIWSKGLTKDFHVQITDVIREYLENRFGIFAIEMTTSEILTEIRKKDYLNDKNFEKLQQVLILADSVKFAKYKALQNENDLSISNSLEFVEDTKEIEINNENTKKVEAEIEITENKIDTEKNLQ